jgi:meso-butanediol dehydrogenase/(S,S)-butanediol dehydrogenase/diacetyl reductase
VISLTKCLALEYGKRGLRVVALAPGGVKTPLTSATKFPEGADMALVSKLMPLMKLAEPEEIAAAVAYLASDEARYVTGTVLSIDGGQTAG